MFGLVKVENYSRFGDCLFVMRKDDARYNDGRYQHVADGKLVKFANSKRRFMTNDTAYEVFSDFSAKPLIKLDYKAN